MFVRLAMTGCLLKAAKLPLPILRLAPPGDRWCDVLAFVPAGSLKLLSTRGGCFARSSVYVVTSLLPFFHKESLKTTVEHRYTPVWPRHSIFQFLLHAHCICETDGMCGLAISLQRQQILYSKYEVIQKFLPGPSYSGLN